MSDEFVHLIVKRLSAEAVRAGVINVAGLTDRELDAVVEDFMDLRAVITHELGYEIHRRAEIRKSRERKVVPLPGCGQPEHYWE